MHFRMILLLLREWWQWHPNVFKWLSSQQIPNLCFLLILCGILEFVKWSPVITQSLTWIYGLHVLSLLLSCLVNLYDEMQAVPTRFLTDDRMAIIIPVFFFNQSLIHNSMTLQESFSLSNPISTLSIEESISSHHLWMIFMRVFSMVHVLSVNPVYSHMYRFIIISY